jgi:hypothetical protein
VLLVVRGVGGEGIEVGGMQRRRTRGLGSGVLRGNSGEVCISPWVAEVKSG